ncbi:MAG: PorV/PorQ family protein, partial [bacterium]|nr:PorV/PorQ family protein [Candidatus Aphodosoma intestinipullorum]
MVYCRLIVISAFICLPLMAAAQAGKDVFQFLNLPTGARQAGFGGSNVSIYDDDLNFVLANPALLSEKTHNMLGINYTNQFADINLGSVLFGRNFGKKNFMAFGIHYIDYGRFLETNEIDEVLGEFTAKDFAVNVIYTRWLSPRWTAGVTMKPIYS